jgi:hypothetical protein
MGKSIDNQDISFGKSTLPATYGRQPVSVIFKTSRQRPIPFTMKKTTSLLSGIESWGKENAQYVKEKMVKLKTSALSDNISINDHLSSISQSNLLTEHPFYFCIL